MDGLLKIDIQEVLTEEYERDLYKTGRQPLDCKYLSKPILEEVNQLIQWYNNNDEHRRYSKLNYPTAEQAALAAQEAAQLPCTKGVHALKGVTQRIHADQLSRTFSYYRKISTPLASKEYWEKCKEGKSLHERAKLDGKQRQWQISIRFAFCNADDLFQRLNLLEEIEAYVWLAEAELIEKRKKGNVASGLAFKRILSQYKLTINEERHAICQAVLGLLKTVSETRDLTREGRVTSQVLPLLKSLGLVPLSDSMPVELEQTLNAERFTRLVNMIEKYGDQKVKAQLRQLSLFCKQDGIFQFVPNDANNALKMIPQVLSSQLTAYPPRWPSWIFQSAWICLNFFDMSAYYRLTQLRQNMDRLPRLMLGNLNQYAEAIQIIERIDQQFNDEIKRVESARPKGILKWIFADATRFFDKWTNHIKEEQKKLFAHKQAMAENIVSAVRHDLLTNTFTLTPTLHGKFSAYLVNWATESKKSSQQERIQETTQKKVIAKNDQSGERCHELLIEYQETTDFVSRFLESIEDRSYLPLQLQTVADLIIYRPDPSRVEAVVKFFSSFLPVGPSGGIRMIGDIIQGKYYPDKNTFDQQLDSLFIGPDHLAMKNSFILTLIDRYVMKNITDVDSPAFQFVQAYEPSLAKQWFELSLNSAEVDQMKSYMRLIVSDIEKKQFSQVAARFEYISRRLDFFKKNHPQCYEQLREMTSSMTLTIKEILRRFIKESPQLIFTFEHEVVFQLPIAYFKDPLSGLLSSAQDIYFFEHDLHEKLIRVIYGENVEILVDELKKVELAREGFCQLSKSAIALLICRLEMYSSIQDDFKKALTAFKRVMMNESDNPAEDKQLIDSLMIDLSMRYETKDSGSNDETVEDANSTVQSIANDYVQVLHAVERGAAVNDDLWQEMEGFYELERDQPILLQHPFLKMLPSYLERYRQSANQYSIVSSLEQTFKHLPAVRSDHFDNFNKRLANTVTHDNKERSCPTNAKRIVYSPTLQRS